MSFPLCPSLLLGEVDAYRAPTVFQALGEAPMQSPPGISF